MEMFTQNFVLHVFHCVLSTMHYDVYPGFLTYEITNICALYSFGQSVHKVDQKLNAHKHKIT